MSVLAAAMTSTTPGAHVWTRHGRPVLSHLLDYLAAGDSLERFLDHFPSVTREQAVAALEIAKDLLTSRATPARLIAASTAG